MLATILNSPVAVEASVRIVRAFVFMREQFIRLSEINSAEVLKKLAELEGHIGQHDKAIALIFTALKGLFEPPAPAKETPRRQIGFQVRETRARYGTRSHKIHNN